MTGFEPVVRSIKTRKFPERRYAEQLIKAHRAHTAVPPTASGKASIRVILVAGNHDVLLDNAFLKKYPERRYGQNQTRDDLIWGDIIYLQDEMTTLHFPSPEHESGGTQDEQPSLRSLTVFGSPWTPKYGVSAFQYHPNNQGHWEPILGSLAQRPDIMVTHGPPRHHLDKRDFHQAGCPHLAQEIRRIRPRLCVFGHIHAAYGREHVLFDGAQQAYEEILTGWAAWGGVLWLAMAVVWARLAHLFRRPRSDEFTILVNAAVVGGPGNQLRNDPIVVDL
ncbi:phosphoesterase [Akanthomyces lecanii RCEF 1005]|uniref:Phosphoesterase n=1 Tax=Akanthomyces lecanii RCEF 1005 TaxID=1081108 RepID=A0A162MRY8_CORDF|nr:phosphoesterase [Akanthomyces lecanii RCEF 1005]